MVKLILFFVYYKLVLGQNKNISTRLQYFNPLRFISSLSKRKSYYFKVKLLVDVAWKKFTDILRDIK